MEIDMKTARPGLHRFIAFLLTTLLVAPLSTVASAQQVPDAPQPQNSAPQKAPAPAGPGQSAAEVASLPNSPAPQNDPGAQQQQEQQPSSTQPTPPQQQGNPSQPMGTAVAPAEPAGGVAATRPAGAAIAPAKQKRSHTLLIRVSLLVGAAVAIGTVVGLSSASPSRP
jgi:hypothetical protein